MECIDDWRSGRPSGASQGAGPARSPDGWARALFDAMRTHDPAVAGVHCYYDVGYPWVRIVSPDDRCWRPVDALALGDLLQRTVGAATPVYFASLQPCAVNFLIDLAPDASTGDARSAAGQPRLQAERYGERIETLRAAWGL